MRWLSKPRPWLLMASLSINLFLIAAIAGAAAFGPIWRGGHPPGVRHMMRAAPPEARATMDEALKTRHAEMREAGDALKRSRRDFREALEADIVDRARLEAAMQERRAARARLVSLRDAAFVEAAVSLDKETRAKLVKTKRHRRRGSGENTQSGGR